MVLGVILPEGWEAEASIEVQATPAQVFPLLNRAARWEEWTPSPESGTEYFGPDEGAGSGRRWDDLGYGQGEFVILSSQPSRSVAYAVQVEEGAIEIQGRIDLDSVSRGTIIRWTEIGDFGWNPLLGYLASRMSNLQSVQLNASLSNLKELVESDIRSPRD
jgi:hypothetical protein